MSNIDKNRRSFLGCVAVAGAAAVTSSTRASAAATREAPEDAVGMLYDTTLCIGCKACVVSCREANGLTPSAEDAPDGLWDRPMTLNASTKNIIKLLDDGEHRSYMKSQCMHCIDPACVGACMIGALQKRTHGIVTWDKDRCIGCRYCQIACPYNVPKFEWDSTDPDIVKCELCDHRLPEGKEPACCEVCPREAVIYGKYEDLLAEAHRRIEANPGLYWEDRVYGETDGGGTQVLYLSHVPFEKLGLPLLGEKSAPSLSRQIQHGIYKGFVAPVALYVALGAVMLRNRKKGGDGVSEGGEK